VVAEVEETILQQVLVVLVAEVLEVVQDQEQEEQLTLAVAVEVLVQVELVEVVDQE